MKLRPDPCPCGCLLPAIRLAGRHDDILPLVRATGGVVNVAPLAIGAVIDQTPGVKLGQNLMVEPSTIQLRLSLIRGVDAERVWRDVMAHLRADLATLGPGNVLVVRSAEPPQRSTLLGKFHQVIAQRPLPGGSESPKT